MKPQITNRNLMEISYLIRFSLYCQIEIILKLYFYFKNDVFAQVYKRALLYEATEKLDETLKIQGYLLALLV